VPWSASVCLLGGRAETPGLVCGWTTGPEAVLFGPVPGEPGRDERTGRHVEPNLRALLRAGDRDAFGVLFDEDARAVYNVGFRLTGNWSAAEEVVSLTFLARDVRLQLMGYGSASVDP
jgi:hypothetical protein